MQLSLTIAYPLLTMKLFTAAQIKDWDAFTIANEPTRSIDLMERAADAATFWLLQNGFNEKDLFYIFCGEGNNGGDGLAIARILFNHHKKVQVFLLDGVKPSADFNTNLKRLETLKIPVKWIDGAEEFPLIPTNAVLVDALFGSGLNRKLGGLSNLLVQHLNHSKNTIIAIDIPSGLMSDGQKEKYTDETIVKANITLTFQQPKLAFLAAENVDFVGDFHVLDIGLNEEFTDKNNSTFEMVKIEALKQLIKPRKKFSHKYIYGHALMLCGSKGMVGAAILSGNACYKAGAGLLSYFLDDETLLPILQISNPEAICLIGKKLEEEFIKKNVVAVGSGWATTQVHEDLLQKVCTSFKGPVVLDAAALTIIANHLDWVEKREPNTTILTPHSGEFDRLFGKSETDVERWYKALKKAEKYRCTIVLKGAYTLTAKPDGTGVFNDSGNPGMATAGSGDVLCGIITSLCAQGYDVEQACTLGAYIHGLAGDLAAKDLSEQGMVAMDIVTYLPKAWKEMEG